MHQQNNLRRRFLLSAGLGIAAGAAQASARPEVAGAFGLIGKLIAQPGRGRELAEILLAGSRGMPGNVAYQVSLDAENVDHIWVHEIWESEAAHRASLQQTSVQEAIARGRPLIERFELSRKTVPVT